MNLESIREEIENYQIATKDQLEAYRMRFINRKGIIGKLFGDLKNLSPKIRKTYGQKLNHVKQLAESKFEELAAQMKKLESKTHSSPDLTLPVDHGTIGAIHPLTNVRGKIISIFEQVGFDISEGPEIEDDWHNFTALNFPKNHPAREMQDTFFIQKNTSPHYSHEQIALRTHTSSVQVRVMEAKKPPIRTLSPGRVFRNEAISARAHCMFHQVEGLYVDENVSFVDLKKTLYYFVQKMFGEETHIRFRPSYFPFTEPSAEMDISCYICGGKGCNICKYTGWVEIAGAGMVDPNVLENCGINPDKYSGFAFGMGIERLTMLKYQIKDLRLFTENDLRFLEQFKSASMV